jgi:hypothetical protein
VSLSVCVCVCVCVCLCVCLLVCEYAASLQHLSFCLGRCVGRNEGVGAVRGHTNRDRKLPKPVSDTNSLLDRWTRCHHNTCARVWVRAHTSHGHTNNVGSVCVEWVGAVVLLCSGNERKWVVAGVVDVSVFSVTELKWSLSVGKECERVAVGGEVSVCVGVVWRECRWSSDRWATFVTKRTHSPNNVNKLPTYTYSSDSNSQFFSTLSTTTDMIW